ncbi:MAG: ATP-dependent zinc metalloprotease FtsH [Eubacteriales bacterium]
MIFWVYTLAMGSNNSSTQSKYSEIISLFQREMVRSFVLQDDVLTLTLYTDITTATPLNSTVEYHLSDTEWFKNDIGALVQAQFEAGIIESYDLPIGFIPPWWLEYLPTLVIFIALAILWFTMLRRQPNASGPRGGGGGPESQFGRARTKSASDLTEKTTFEQVAGAKEEKEELEEIVAFLKDPKKYDKLGARIPKGILLVGPPGTGKTLLAKATAGEAGVHFLSISGSDFVELYVGVGAARVRSLFEQAKLESPAIIFIDEIDAVGRRRGAGLGGGHDEREQTLNQLLVEMDGFGGNSGVIVMAATNRHDILDPALLRPGRFDRQIYVGLPDISGRESILKVHAKRKPLGDDVSLKEIAQGTTGFTGADLENLLNEGALLAARADSHFITSDHLKEAMLKVVAGPEKRSRVVTEHSRRLTAYHEAGHAIVISQLKTQDPVHQITIIPRGTSGGMTISLPLEDRSYQSKIELQDRLATYLGGRVAEALVLGDISTGASNDIERASATARAMVTKYGMSDALGTISYTSGEQEEVFIGRSMGQARSYSEEIAGQIDKEVHLLIDTAYHRCEDILKEFSAELELTAQFLLSFETMNAEDFGLVFTDPNALHERMNNHLADSVLGEETSSSD